MSSRPSTPHPLSPGRPPFLVPKDHVFFILPPKNKQKKVSVKYSTKAPYEIKVSSVGFSTSLLVFEGSLPFLCSKVAQLLCTEVSFFVIRRLAPWGRDL